MKGLLLKDFINLRQQVKTIGLVLLVWSVLAITRNNVTMIGGMVCILSATLPITALAYDEKAKWDKYALTMPVSREDMVLSKYVLSLILSGLGFVLSFVIHWYISNNILDSLALSGAFMGVGILLFSLVLPLMFKFGVEKGRLLMFLVVLLPVIGGMALQSQNLPKPEPSTLETIAYLLPVAVILIFLASLWISIRIYRKKEF